MKQLSTFLAATDRLASRNYFPWVLLPMAALFVTFYSKSTSPLFWDEGCDSCVFKTMGLAILQGKTPYLDYFDHKGPLLYFINALGEWMIAGRTGIFLLQIVGLTLVLTCLFKTASLFLRRGTSFLLLFVLLLVYGGFYQEGNQCEEWTLVAVAPVFYYALSFLIKHPEDVLPFKFSLLFGFCFGCAFFIRPNDAVSCIGGLVFGLYLYMVCKGHIKPVLCGIAAFALGFIVVCVPILVFFASRDALGDLVFGLLVFNGRYSGGAAGFLTSCFTHYKLLYLGLLATILLLAYSAGERRTIYLLAPYALLVWFFTGKAFFPHYLIPSLPLFLLFFVFLIKQQNKIIVGQALLMFGMFSTGNSSQLIKVIPGHFCGQFYHAITGDKKNKVLVNELSALLDNVPLSERNEIWNENLGWSDISYYSLFFHNGIVPCNRTSYYAMLTHSPELQASDNIQTKKPLWIVLTHRYYNEGESSKIFIKNHDVIERNYTLVARTDTTVCDVELWKKKSL